MMKREVIGIMAILETAYPNYYAKQTEQKRMEAAALWCELFKDDPAELVAAAVKTIIVGSENPYPPTIAQIKAKMHDLTSEAEISETEAWALVSKACGNGIYHYQDEFDKLPPTVQAAVGRPEQLREWALMDADTVESVVASNFMRGYKAAQKRERENALLPDSVRALLAGIAKPMLPEKRQRLLE